MKCPGAVIKATLTHREFWILLVSLAFFFLGGGGEVGAITLPAKISGSAGTRYLKFSPVVQLRICWYKRPFFHQYHLD